MQRLPNDRERIKEVGASYCEDLRESYLKVIVRGWFYLSTILSDYSRYVIGWKLCGKMRAENVTDTLEIALAASGGSVLQIS